MLQTVIDRFNDCLRPMLVPLFSEQHGEYKLVGTGSLLQIADATLLLTAYHVLELNVRHGFPLWVGRGEHEPNARAVAGEIVSFTDDESDVGILRLPVDVARDVLAPAQLRPLRWSQLFEERADRAPQGCYVICGFPSDAAEQESGGSLLPTTLCVSTNLLPGDRSGLESRFNPALHYLFEFREGLARNLGTGEDVALPAPDGMSGSVVWRICRADVPFNPSTWTPEQAAAVGIFTGWYRQPRSLKATSMVAVTTLIRREFDDLRPALNLLRPPPAQRR